ncbi:hypothetical protein A946_00150 [Methylacidiphilum kamchatkense Kam1]|uniref:HEPN AbiU2-like domain-containing protein n=1 Tax=Methylacidiphilum kamchatkense Kam1 TaxID=1202785 RepID=A0A0C1RMB8_9BACT|nr:hypothetical protein A946_00150 [Methylacidiphilum kamchatkense Kam1]QDQ42856.1 hypothetical protein kam1_1641 [Methylacidiphilum kamchatkense Kam1]
MESFRPDIKEAIIQVGWLLNEANWLRKLFMISLSEINENAECEANVTLRSILLAILAGKIYEGIQLFFENNKKHTNLKKLVEKLCRDCQETADRRKKLEKLLTENKKIISNIRHIRNNFAFHYQASLIPAQWPPIVKKETPCLPIYLTDHDGDYLSFLSTIAFFQKLIEPIDQKERQEMEKWDKTKWEEAIEKMGKLILHVSSVYYEFLVHIFSNLLKTYGGDKEEELPISQAPKYNEQVIKFFMHPPSKEELENYKKQLKNRSLRFKVKKFLEYLKKISIWLKGLCRGSQPKRD